VIHHEVEGHFGFLENIRKRLDSLSEKADKVTQWFCISIVLVMTVEVLIGVFFRYALDAPIKWGEELARLMMMWVGLLGIAIALKDGDHMGLEMFVKRFSGRPLALCNLAANCLVGIFLVILLIWGLKVAIAGRVSVLPALQISWTWSLIAVPITAGIQIIHVSAQIFKEVLAIVNPQGQSDQEPEHV
jgi:TRAP-type C4-dicarboxylate transport system permease small subunit